MRLFRSLLDLRSELLKKVTFTKAYRLGSRALVNNPDEESYSWPNVMEIGLFGELLRGRRANIGKRCVNSKLVAKYKERSIYRRSEIVDHLAKKLIQGIGVQ
jgi:hypothetical protein